MSGHQAPGKNFHSFVLLRITQCVGKYAFVFDTRKNIYSCNNSKANKIHALWIMKFIIPAHGLKIVGYLVSHA